MRRRIAALALATMAVWGAPRDAAALPVAPPLGDADYLAFADGVAGALAPRWDEAAGGYVSGRRGATARTNANLLIVHAAAARLGHTGPARQDEHARRMVTQFTSPPMFALSAGRRSTSRTACWRKLLTGGARDHVSLDSQIAEALAAAWRARAELQLDAATQGRLRGAVDACARHPAWRYPQGLRNQINWNAQLYAADAVVTGRGDLLRRDYRRHLLRFVRGAARTLPGMGVPYLGRGLGFHYSPHLDGGRPSNWDAPEYALIVASALGHLPAAAGAGMPPLPGAARALLRRWVARLLTGAWTHAGYLNWDTGLGLGRWHSGQYWAFAQQGLLAIATTPAVQPRPEYGPWAKALFDHGLLLYDAWAREAGTALAPQLPFDVFSQHRDRDLYASRIAANAIRALELGLGTAPAGDPPPLFSYDSETGRLAVTTPAYATAVVPDTNGAFPYGGIELARLHGAGQRVLATTGGVPPHAFGVVVHDASGRLVLASQGGGREGARLRLDRDDANGSFRALTAWGELRARGIRVRTTHRFTSAAIEVRWLIDCRGRCGPYDVDVLFPSWGAGASISPAAGGFAVGDGYDVLPLAPGPAPVALPTTPQPTAPHPGPTAAVRLLQAGVLERLSYGVRIVPHGPSS